MRRFVLLPLFAIGLATMLGGCVLFPDDYGYGRGGGYYRGGYGGGYGGGWGHRHYDHDRR